MVDKVALNFLAAIRDACNSLPKFFLEVCLSIFGAHKRQADLDLNRAAAVGAFDDRKLCLFALQLFDSFDLSLETA